MIASIYYSEINDITITVKPMGKPNFFYIEERIGGYLLNEENLRLTLSLGQYELIGYL